MAATTMLLITAWFSLSRTKYVKLNKMHEIKADSRGKNVYNIDDWWKVSARLQLVSKCLVKWRCLSSVYLEAGFGHLDQESMVAHFGWSDRESWLADFCWFDHCRVNSIKELVACCLVYPFQSALFRLKWGKGFWWLAHMHMINEPQLNKIHNTCCLLFKWICVVFFCFTWTFSSPYRVPSYIAITSPHGYWCPHYRKWALMESFDGPAHCVLLIVQYLYGVLNIGPWLYMPLWPSRLSYLLLIIRYSRSA